MKQKITVDTMDKAIQEKFNSYPLDAKQYLTDIRALIFSVSDKEKIGKIEETLKWGQASYKSSKGSPIRIDWNAQYPEQVSVYFHCQTILVDTFREIYKDNLQFIDNREIVIPLSSPIPTKELSHCISLALRYHQIKHLPLLGV